MKRSTRVLLIVGLSLLVLYLLLMLILGISPHVNDRDLQISREPVAEESNNFALLETARRQMWWPETEKAELWELVRDTNWNAALAAKVLQNNAQAYTTLDAALAKPACQVPPFEWPGEGPKTYLTAWKELSQLEAIRGNALFHAGKEKEAFDHALNIVRLGAQLEDSGGDYLHYLVGMAIKSQGLHQMQRWAFRTRLEPRQLAAMAKQLQPLESVEAALGNTLKFEYQGQMQVLAKLRSGVHKPQDAPPMIRVKLLPVFNFGKTKRLLANYTRDMLAALPVSYNEARKPEMKRPGPVSLICSGNLAGEVFYWLLRSSEDHVVPRKCMEVVAIRATRIELALRAYQLKNGRLPPNLSTLVPEFLDEVPLDDFDAQPLRYLPHTKLIYSVSENLRDDNGVETQKKFHRPDYVFPFNL